MARLNKIFYIHYKDENGLTGNYKPIQATSKRSAKEIFNSFAKFKDCKVLSVN